MKMNFAVGMNANERMDEIAGSVEEALPVSGKLIRE